MIARIGFILNVFFLFACPTNGKTQSYASLCEAAMFTGLIYVRKGSVNRYGVSLRTNTSIIKRFVNIHSMVLSSSFYFLPGQLRFLKLNFQFFHILSISFHAFKRCTVIIPLMLYNKILHTVFFGDLYYFWKINTARS